MERKQAVKQHTLIPLALDVPEAQRKDLGGNLYLLLEAGTHLSSVSGWYCVYECVKRTEMVVASYIIL